MGMERKEEPKYPSLENWLKTLKQLRKLEGEQGKYLLRDEYSFPLEMQIRDTS